MRIRRALPVLMMMIFTLTGCFRQAPDTFDTVESDTDIQGQTIDNTTTPIPDTPVIVDPDAGVDDTATPDRPDPTVTGTPAATTTTLPVTNTRLPLEPTATIRIVQPTSAPTLTPRQTTRDDTTVSTATPQFVTPGVNTQRDFPTNTPAAASAGNGTDSGDDMTTPTALPGTEGGACEYIVQSGDNLFRIAINNDISLEALREANNLSEGAIIQPGQRLVIPGCEETADASDETIEATDTAPAPTPFTGEGILYEVKSGDTLFTIAREFGVTIQEIIDANELANPDRLSIGQELVIPVEDDSSSQ